LAKRKQDREKGRSVLLLERRDAKMARTAHAYVRGNTTKFYEWLEESSKSIPEGPAVWICGDCHVGNLGPVADLDGNVRIQIRDLDQTVIGNPAHDLIRLGLSLATAARGSNLPGVTTARMIEQIVEGYTSALADPSSHRRTPHAAVQPVFRVMQQAVSRRWSDLARDRIKDLRPNIPRGRNFLDLAKIEEREIARLVQSESMRRLVTALRDRDDDAQIEVLDAAYWVKGCSSLGRLRYAVLVGVGNGKPKKKSICLLDIKEAATAAAPRYPGVAIPRDNAERVVEGARHLSPHLGERMLANSLLDRSVVVRELMPQDLKLELDTVSEAEAVNVARYLGLVVGEAHARQMDHSARRGWHKTLVNHRSKSIDAPSWFWSSVVALEASHEAAYLEHCRRIAGPNKQNRHKE
jgi:uncharacterized protein (DUF2252 family)